MQGAGVLEGKARLGSQVFTASFLQPTNWLPCPLPGPPTANAPSGTFEPAPVWPVLIPTIAGTYSSSFQLCNPSSLLIRLFPPRASGLS